MDARTTGDDTGPVGIAAGPAGHVLLLDSTDGREIRCRVGERWLTVPGGALQVAVGGLPHSAAQLNKPLRKSLPKNIALRASDGRYINAASGAGESVSEPPSKQVPATGQPDDPLVLKSSTVGVAETFVAVPAGFGKFGRLAACGYYVRTFSGSDTRLTPHSSSGLIRGEETFTVYDLRDGKVALKAANGRFVQVGDDGSVTASSPRIGGAETFTLVEIKT